MRPTHPEAVVEGRPVLTLAAADHERVIEALAELLIEWLDREVPLREEARAGGHPAGFEKERTDATSHYRD